MRSVTKSSIVLFVLVAALAAGCSSSQKAESGAPGDMGALESGADPIGSVPEDMLEQAEAEAEVSESVPENLAPDGTDPFADLTVDPATETNTENLATAEEATIEGFATPESSGATETYEVKRGDTLMKIAFTLYGDIDRWQDLYEWNRSLLKKASQLSPGMKLTYEPPLEPFHPDQLAHSYTIKSGDTLAGIADEVYGRKMKYKKLQGYNDRMIKNPNRIFAGFTIFYDITPQEMAEAEARRQERMAMQNGGGAQMEGSLPSALKPPTPSAPAPAPLAAFPAPAAPSAPPTPAPPAPASTRE